MNKFNDITGERFGYLTAIKKVGFKNKSTLWECKCDCGNTTIVQYTNLKKGRTVSCGCWNNKKRFTHKLSNHKLYGVYHSMKQRCYNSKSNNYALYGGKGIEVCTEWRTNFLNFYNWAMVNGYKEGLSIDRINSNGNYEPSNCRWVSQKVQANNISRNHILEFRGEKHTISEWGEITGIGRKNISNRINNKGWSIEKTLTTPVKGR